MEVLLWNKPVDNRIYNLVLVTEKRPWSMEISKLTRRTSYPLQLCIHLDLGCCTHNVLQSRSSQALSGILHKYVYHVYGEKSAMARSGDWHLVHLSLGRREDAHHILSVKQNATGFFLFSQVLISLYFHIHSGKSRCYQEGRKRS